MNDNCSTTGVKTSERLSDSKQLEFQWKSINWKKAEAEVNRLQVRIVKVTQKMQMERCEETSISYYAFFLCKSTRSEACDHKQREENSWR